MNGSGAGFYGCKLAGTVSRRLLYGGTGER
jgi:hypothetical protein